MSCQRPAIIPAPERLVPREGSFLASPQTRILLQSDPEVLEDTGRILAGMLGSKNELLYAGETARGVPPSGSILITTRRTDEPPGVPPEDLGREGYELDINPGRVVIRARTAAGAFYGVQTLRQLLDPCTEEQGRGEGPWTVPAMWIRDRPRFAWRGMLLDCCRHFMSVDFVKRYLDLLGRYKMNRFHWHLTEDQGWRLEIKRYPKLTETGGWRKESDGSTYGGFYSHEEVREVLRHAERNQITVIPEIEMPGHCQAALASYPRHSCRETPLEVGTGWGIFEEVFCPGKDSTFEFLRDVLTEVATLFPGPFLHTGGDECPTVRWRECSHCRARVAEEGLRGMEELQTYFTNRMVGVVKELGKRFVAWDEVLGENLDRSVIVQAWRSLDHAAESARMGHDVIVSPLSHAYFDYDLKAIDLRKVYEFNPVPPGLTQSEARHILGGACNMWTERAPQETVDGKVFPRLLAMSERLWTNCRKSTGSEERSFEEFLERASVHRRRLAELDVSFNLPNES